MATSRPSAVPRLPGFVSGVDELLRVIWEDSADLRRAVIQLADETDVPDHGALAGLSDDDHTQYVHTSVARTLSTTLTVAAAGSIDFDGPLNIEDSAPGITWHASGVGTTDWTAENIGGTLTISPGNDNIHTLQIGTGSKRGHLLVLGNTQCAQPASFQDKLLLEHKAASDPISGANELALWAEEHEAGIVGLQYRNESDGLRRQLFPRRVQTITSTAYTINSGGAADDIILADDDTAGAGVTITLPANPIKGQDHTIKKLGTTANVTVGRNGNNIEGAASDYTLTTQYESVTLAFDGDSTWWILAKV